MHDGVIVHDERKSIGEVAPTAKRVMYSVPETTAEDDMAGVTALMNHLPDAEPAPSLTSKQKTRKSTKRGKKGRK